MVLGRAAYGLVDAEKSYDVRFCQDIWNAGEAWIFSGL